MSTHFDEIRSTFERFSEAWKSNDGAAVAAFFVEDGSLVNPFGQRADGRSAIAGMYSEYYGGMLRGTSTSVDLASVRAVESSHAFADGEQTVHAPDGSVLLAVHIAALLRREGDGWRFVDSRPYVFADIPG
jgi:uncharacterized protein (TIGR02246 family)